MPMNEAKMSTNSGNERTKVVTRYGIWPRALEIISSSFYAKYNLGRQY